MNSIRICADANVVPFRPTEKNPQPVFDEVEDPEALWKIMCFERVPEEDKVTGEPIELEFKWEATGKVIGYKDDNINRPLYEDFTEETAREEFARWTR